MQKQSSCVYRVLSNMLAELGTSKPVLSLTFYLEKKKKKGKNGDISL